MFEIDSILIRSSIKKFLLIGTIIAIEFFALLVTGCTSKESDSSKGTILFQDGEFEIVDGGPIEFDTSISNSVRRATDRYQISSDVETCSELAEWYVNGLEIAFEGELANLVESNSDFDIILQIISEVNNTLIDRLVGSLKGNSSLCPRDQPISNKDITITEFKPITQEILSSFEQTGASFSFHVHSGLSTAIAIVEGHQTTFDIETYSNDK